MSYTHLGSFISSLFIEYSWLTNLCSLYKFQDYSFVIQYFCSLYSIKSY